MQPNFRSSPQSGAVRGGVEGGAVEQLCRETMTNAVNGEASPKIRGEKINLNFGKCFSTNEKPSVIFLLYTNGKLQPSDVLEGKSGGKSSIAI